jgi:hypothetical protein
VPSRAQHLDQFRENESAISMMRSAGLNGWAVTAMFYA